MIGLGGACISGGTGGPPAGGAPRCGPCAWPAVVSRATT